MENTSDALTIIVFSGDMDKVMAAFNIAIGGAAMGKETSMFFTFWGMKAIQKGNFTGSSFFGKMLGIMNRGGISRIGPSRFNFWGMGRWMFNQMMNSKKITPLAELRKTAIDLGVKLLPCQMSMDVMEIKQSDLIDEAQCSCGVATMLELAYKSKATIFV
jgi:peroxiredoxin family protein